MKKEKKENNSVKYVIFLLVLLFLHICPRLLFLTYINELVTKGLLRRKSTYVLLQHVGINYQTSLFNHLRGCRLPPQRCAVKGDGTQQHLGLEKKTISSAGSLTHLFVSLWSIFNSIVENFIEVGIVRLDASEHWFCL